MHRNTLVKESYDRLSKIRDYIKSLDKLEQLEESEPAVYGQDMATEKIKRIHTHLGDVIIYECIK